MWRTLTTAGKAATPGWPFQPDREAADSRGQVGPVHSVGRPFCGVWARTISIDRLLCMDYDNAISVLNEHKRLIYECGQTQWLTKDRKTAMEKLNEHGRAVNGILQSLGFGVIGGSTLTWHRDSVGKIDRALNVLESNRMMVEANTRVGQPALPMSVLHPLIYQAAYVLWNNGSYRHAVADAATSLSNFTQNRLRRHDVSDKDLMAQVFSEKPSEKGEARLRAPGKRDSETTRSLQQGAKLFAMGAFQAIRNPAHHTTGNGDPVAAFESLAALSKVARWVSEWRIDEYFEPIDLTQISAAQVALAHKRTLKP
jgi:hypothetical protein